MKSNTLLIALVLMALSGLLSFSSSAQITLGPDWLFEAGFRMDLHVDNAYADPDGNISKSGADQEWSFTNLGIDDTTSVTVRNASEGSAFSNFPSADLVFATEQSVGFVTSTSELYLQRNGNNLDVIGIADSDPNALLPAFPLTDPLRFQTTPLTYLSETSDQTFLRLTFPPDILTAILMDSTVAGFIDSVGVSIGQDVDSRVDGWGQLNLGGNYFNALRVRTVTEASQEIEVKAPFVGWVPISQFVTLGDSIDFNAQRTVDYSWIVAEYSYPVARVVVDSTGSPENLTYASNAVSGTTSPRQKVGLTVTQLANELLVTAASELTKQGRVEVYGANGSLLETSGIALDQGVARFDTSSWPSGFVLVTAWNGNELVATQKVVAR